MSSRPTSKVYRKRTLPLHNGLGMKNPRVRDRNLERRVGCGFGRLVSVFRRKKNPAGAEQSDGVKEKETVWVENLKCCLSTRPRFAVRPY